MNPQVFVAPALGMVRYRDPVLRPYVPPYVNICDHPSVDPTVQVHNSETMRYFSKTWYKYKALSDNVDRARAITPPTFFTDFFMHFTISVYESHPLNNSEGGSRVVRWYWVNFQCQGVLQLGLQ